jgi:hypothetical protein
MKIRPIFFSLMLLTVLSCHKDNIVSSADKVGISSVVYFPAITLKGDANLIFQQNDPYVDPGATAILQGKSVMYTAVPSTINTAVPGVYPVTYSAANAQGDVATASRIVIVVPSNVASDNAVAANDFSGTYLRAATGVTSTWTKIGNGVYTVENAGGASSGVGFTLIAANYSGNTISIPVQNSAAYGGQVSADNGTYIPGSPAMYSWIFHAPNYGAGVRTFVKQ